MKIFVYGKLKKGRSKGWMVPFSKSSFCVIKGYKMYKRKNGAAAAVKGNQLCDKIIGQVRETNMPKIFEWLLLKFLDVNEGCPWGVYERVKAQRPTTARNQAIDGAWIYLYKGNVDNLEMIKRW